ncbi:MAG: FAD-binding oxidoreductase [Elusimicrobiota bacterium]
MPREATVKVKEVIPRTPDVKSIRVETGGDIPFQAGQFLAVTLHDPSLKRFLSISSSPTEKGYIEFTKKLTSSDFSKAFDELRPGDPVTIRYPMGRFTFDPAHPKAAFLSGGIGITPIRSICAHLVDSKADADMVLLYGNWTMKDIAFKDDFDAMQARCPRLRVVHVLAKPGPAWKGRSGFVTAQLLREEIPDFLERRFYVCGPPGMVDAMRKILAQELSFPQDRIVTESFQGY